MVLPEGSKSLVPVTSTEVDRSGVDAGSSMSTLGSLSERLQACDLLADLTERQGWSGDRQRGNHRERPAVAAGPG